MSNKILSEASEFFNTHRGFKESELAWKFRTLYSICGLMAYTSLIDEQYDEQGSVSKAHITKRVNDILNSYLQIHTGLAPYFKQEGLDLAHKILKIFQDAGVVYNKPNRYALSIPRSATCHGVTFQRGIDPDDIQCVSGVGIFTSKLNSSKQSTELAAIESQDDIQGIHALRDMFGLQTDTLNKILPNLLSKVKWSNNTLNLDEVKCLRIKPPFTKGYFTQYKTAKKQEALLPSSQDSSLYVSLLSTDQTVYLYRFKGDTMQISLLPNSLLDSLGRRTLNCACLTQFGSLPSIDYRTDGSIVHVNLNYLLPEPEMNLIRLYSWPEIISNEIDHSYSDFAFCMSSEVFVAIKALLSYQGYTFSQGLS